MIFDFFKKNEVADVIFKGGKIYTLDPDAPWAEAVACKNGRIMAVGDADIIAGLEGNATEIVDLNGGTLLPGFMDTSAHPVLLAFSKVCLIVYEDMTFEEVLNALSAYISANPDNPSYFAYGFNTAFILNKTNEEIQSILDNMCADKPVVLLDISGFDGWFNTKAMETVRAAIDEEKEKPIITLSYVLHTLSPINFDKLQEAVVELAAEYCRKGCTTVFDCGSPDYLHAIYQEMAVEMLQVDMLKQRFIGSLLITRNISAEYIVKKLLQKKTSCSETEEYISCPTLKLIITSSAGPEKSTSISYDLLRILAIQVSDNGFKTHIDAIGKDAVSEAFEAVFLARAAGYKKAHFTLAHSCEMSQEEETELLLDNELCVAPATLGDFSIKYKGIENAAEVADAIDRLTIDAAIQLGISDDYGSIESDKRADFVIFDENPLECNLPRFRGLKAAKTVIGGKIVYDAATDQPEKWYETIKAEHQAIQDQLLQEDEYEDYEEF